MKFITQHKCNQCSVSEKSTAFTKYTSYGSMKKRKCIIQYFDVDNFQLSHCYGISYLNQDEFIQKLHLSVTMMKEGTLASLLSLESHITTYRQFLMAGCWRVPLFLALLTLNGCSSVDAAVWERQAAEPGKTCVLTLQGSPGCRTWSCTKVTLCARPSHENLSSHTNKKAWENKLKPLSCLHGESSARGHGGELLLNAWECCWGCHTTNQIEAREVLIVDSYFSFDLYKFGNSSVNFWRI